MYGPDGSRFFTIDPKAEQFPWQSPYAYAANNPIKFIDFNGNNPVIIIGGIALTAADIALISCGVITSGIILHQTHDGSLAFNQSVVDYWTSLSASWNPDYEWQQKQSKAAKTFNDALGLAHQEMLNRNMGDGNNDENKYKTGGALAISIGVLELYLNTKEMMNQARFEVNKNISSNEHQISAIKNDPSLTPEQKKQKIDALSSEMDALKQQNSNLNDAIDYTNGVIDKLNNKLFPSAESDATRYGGSSQGTYEQMMQDLKNW